MLTPHFVATETGSVHTLPLLRKLAQSLCEEEQLHIQVSDTHARNNTYSNEPRAQNDPSIRLQSMVILTSNGGQQRTTVDSGPGHWAWTTGLDNGPASRTGMDNGPGQWAWTTRLRKQRTEASNGSREWKLRAEATDGSHGRKPRTAATNGSH